MRQSITAEIAAGQKLYGIEVNCTFSGFKNPSRRGKGGRWGPKSLRFRQQESRPERLCRHAFSVGLAAASASVGQRSWVSGTIMRMEKPSRV